MDLSPEARRFMDAPEHYFDAGTTRIAYKKFGQGPPLVMLHGWPLSGVSFSKLVRQMEDRFTCYVPDLPGCGKTEWSEQTDFSIPGRARTLSAFLRGVDLENYFLLAHDTGATIARMMALIEGNHIRKFALLNTEIPFHRPPWVPLYRQLLALPGSTVVFRTFLRSRKFLHSPMGFAGCFYAQSLLDGDFHELAIRPLIDSPRLLRGQALALRGIDWSVVDGMAENHKKISMPVLLVWGEDDPFFPIARAREMATQFPHCEGVRAVPGTRLVLHEEKPFEVGKILTEFFLKRGPAGERN